MVATEGQRRMNALRVRGLLLDGDVCEGCEGRHVIVVAFAGGGRGGRMSGPQVTCSVRRAGASWRVSEMRV